MYYIVIRLVILVLIFCFALPYLTVFKKHLFSDYYWLCLGCILHVSALPVPPFPFESKAIFYRKNIMTRCGAHVLFIPNRNECKNEMGKRRSSPNHKRRNNEEIDDGHDGETRNQAKKTAKKIILTLLRSMILFRIKRGLMRNSWQYYLKKTLGACLIRRMTNKNFMDFKTCKRNSLFLY